jgi:uncharacterized protein YbjQ (UPF0145 family)
MLPNSLYLRHMTNILITTTPTVENCPVQEYLGIVSGMAFMRRRGIYWKAFDYDPDILDYWKSFDYDPDTEDNDNEDNEDPAADDWADFKAALHKARDWAIQQMAEEAASLGANAVIGVKIDYKTVQEEERVMVVIATGTAVRL